MIISFLVLVAWSVTAGLIGYWLGQQRGFDDGWKLCEQTNDMVEARKRELLTGGNKP